MAGFWLVALVVLSGWAIIEGQGAKWKVLNLVIILAFMAGGFGIAVALVRIWGGNPEIGGHAAVPLMILLGCVGALGSIRRNKMRAKNAPTSAAGVQ
jgi:hypothetical protein